MALKPKSKSNPQIPKGATPQQDTSQKYPMNIKCSFHKHVLQENS